MSFRRSRSQSPTKGYSFPDRTPLSLKDSNVYGSGSSSRNSSPLKASFPRLSQSSRSQESRSSFYRKENSVSPKKASPKRPSSFALDNNVSLSPTKKLKSNTTPALKHQPNSTLKSFKIFEDPGDYNKKLRSKFEEALKICDLAPETKENIFPFVGRQQEDQHIPSENVFDDKIPQKLLKGQRRPLYDLSIIDYPGYAQVLQYRKSSGVLSPKSQLMNSWMLKFGPSRRHSTRAPKIRMPSFVTPPKKSGLRFRYISSLDQRKHRFRVTDTGRPSNVNVIDYPQMGTDSRILTYDADFAEAKRRLKFPIYDDNIRN